MLSLANERGYVRVTLSDHERKKKSHWVHRLVLLAFVGPCPDGMETLHGVGGSADNRVSNLRWGTPTENAQDIVKHGHNLNANKTSCKRGHALSGTNLLLRNEAGTWRGCRACTRELVHAHARGRDFSTDAADARYARYVEEERKARQ